MASAPLPAGTIAIAFFGDIVGGLGRRAVAAAIPRLRESHGVSVFIANAENAKNGSGLSPDNYREVRRSGVQVVTLGDHVFKDRAICEYLRDAGEPVARPANLAPGAPGKTISRIELPAPGGTQPLYVLTVLGRVHMPMPSDNPFLAVDRELAAIREPNAMAIVEVHGEVTSEKQAIAWHCLERWTAPGGAKVISVVGSHTHVQTSDARLLDQQVAAITDLGMCGPHRSVIGRDIRATIDMMASQLPIPLEVAGEDNRACGVIVRVETGARRACGVEAFNIGIPD